MYYLYDVEVMGNEKTRAMNSITCKSEITATGSKQKRTDSWNMAAHGPSSEGSVPTNQASRVTDGLRQAFLELQFTKKCPEGTKQGKEPRTPSDLMKSQKSPFHVLSWPLQASAADREPTSPTLSTSAKWGCYFSCYKQLIMIVWKSGLETLDPFNNI